MMKHFVALLLLFALPLAARYSMVAIDSCGAYNNLNQTKNSGNVHLEIGKRYTVYKKHKGHYLIALKDAHPAQRWVEESCLMSNTDNVTPVTQETLPIAPIPG